MLICISTYAQTLYIHVMKTSLNLPCHQANSKNKFSNDNENGRSKGQIVVLHGLPKPHRCGCVRNPQSSVHLPNSTNNDCALNICSGISFTIHPLPYGSGQVLSVPEFRTEPGSPTPPTKITLRASLTLILHTSRLANWVKILSKNPKLVLTSLASPSVYTN